MICTFYLLKSMNYSCALVKLPLHVVSVQCSGSKNIMCLHPTPCDRSQYHLQGDHPLAISFGYTGPLKI